MTLDRTDIVKMQFIDAINQDCLPIVDEPLIASMDKDKLVSLFDSQIKSRLLDIVARKLKEKGQSFYTIGSSGHEGNAVMGQVFPYTDMAFLHYRSGAFFIERAKQLEIDGVDEVLHSLVAAKTDSIANGRHKVFGSVPLTIPPQTSTIASHLPKALGAALSINHKRDDDRANQCLKKDGVILVSFGDASFNHASCQTTINATSRLAYLKYPVPLIFICEDNGIGISVPTPKDWVKNSVITRAGIHYIVANGLSLYSLMNASFKANDIARHQKAPVFLHMQCKRLLGHAGSDIEQQYLSLKQIEANEAHCPLLYSAAYLINHQIMTKSQILSLYQDIEETIWQKAKMAIDKPKLNSAKSIMQSITPKALKKPAVNSASIEQRKACFKEKFSQLLMPRTMQQLINLALTDLMLQHPNAIIFGEDVAKKGGVYRVTADLVKQFGNHRVFDTILDETTILGTAIGYAHNGFLPVPEIQFLAYLHNAEDQLRGEAATLSFFSSGQYQNPMVIRIPALAYQKGFGGHFHNDNSIAVLRDIPGIVIACPSNGEDAVKLLRQAFKLAYQKGLIVVFLEPIALYMTKDLHQKDDGLWLCHYPKNNESYELGEVSLKGEGDILLITYGNGSYLCHQAKNKLMEKGINVKILDLLWLKPLAVDAIITVAKDAKAILIVDEGRKTGGLSEELMSILMDNLGSALPKTQRICGEDSFITLGSSWHHLLPSCEKIIEAVEGLAKGA